MPSKCLPDAGKQALYACPWSCLTCMPVAFENLFLKFSFLSFLLLLLLFSFFFLFLCVAIHLRKVLNVHSTTSQQSNQCRLTSANINKDSQSRPKVIDLAGEEDMNDLPAASSLSWMSHSNHERRRGTSRRNDAAIDAINLSRPYLHFPLSVEQRRNVLGRSMERCTAVHGINLPLHCTSGSYQCSTFMPTHLKCSYGNRLSPCLRQSGQ